MHMVFTWAKLVFSLVLCKYFLHPADLVVFKAYLDSVGMKG